MKRILVSSCLLVLLASNAFAAAKDPVVLMNDGKVSIQVEAVTLKQFLQLLDAATGMTSKVSPQLANEKISVRLSGLDLDAAIRKSFQGQPWNYFVVIGKGISVLDRAQAVAASTGGVSSSPVQPFVSDIRNDAALSPAPNPAALSQPGPVPVPVNAGTGNQPAGAINIPPAQGGTAAPAPLFQTPGSSLGAPLPSAQPAK